MFQNSMTATNVPHTDGIDSLFLSLTLPLSPSLTPIPLLPLLCLYAFLSISIPQFTGAPLTEMAS